MTSGGHIRTIRGDADVVILTGNVKNVSKNLKANVPDF